MTPQEAYEKALKLGKRIPKLEPLISKDATYSFRYAKHVIKGKFILAEQTISKNVFYSFLYAKDIIKDRWELAEPVILKDAFYSFHYATDVIKGRLPDFMHNQMILSNDEYTKQYVEYIK